MATATSYDELYDTIGTIVESVTGREWWRRTGMQSQPQSGYAVVFLGSVDILAQQVVEDIELDPPATGGECFRQVTWGTSIIDCEIDFYRNNGNNDTAAQAATRFRNSLHHTERFYDFWKIAGLLGNVRQLDISGEFRADIEPRQQIRFQIQANVALPVSLSGSEIFDIGSQEINITHVQQDGTETEVKLNVDNPS